MRLALGLAAATSFIVYGLAIQRFFARPDGMRPQMRRLSLVGTLGAASHLISLAFLRIQSLPWLATALLLYASGLILFGWAWHATRDSPLPLAFSTTQSLGLVTSGPYRFVRHPFYVAYSLTWLAGTIAAPNVVVVAASATLVALYVDAARGEERQMLSGVFGGAYREYVGRNRG